MNRFSAQAANQASEDANRYFRLFSLALVMALSTAAAMDAVHGMSVPGPCVSYHTLPAEVEQAVQAAWVEIRLAKWEGNKRNSREGQRRVRFFHADIRGFRTVSVATGCLRMHCHKQRIKFRISIQTVSAMELRLFAGFYTKCRTGII